MGSNPQPPKRAITLADAERMLRSAGDLLAAGATERRIRQRVAEGVLVRIRRGHYATAEDWRRLWPEGRHLMRVLAVCRDAATAPVLSHVSAAVVHGFPLYRLAPTRVHVTVPSPSHAASVPDVLRHELPLDDTDVVEIGPFRLTGLNRTAIDVARTLRLEAAQSIADAALRRVAVTGHRQDADAAGVWREDLHYRLERLRGRPGVRRARDVVDFADGRAQLPGESVSRLRLRRLGFREVQLQVPVTGPGGNEFFIDFGLDEIDAYGEFDGMGKYVDPVLRGDKHIEETVLSEKRRADWVHGTTGRRMLRWESEHIATVHSFAARLAAFGVPLTSDLQLDRRRLR
ncbi:type IV toxin-antitoxin system AbiEi family antitoxin domain-containing protein [Microbacterium sp.]|uniref:type IV toxin-antitoxin system AbiEi family antitoxin domain-containing protein n=1 Tax=Microbacterium sp. TaxID=51671 RepID=UPI0028120223|nr:type IV toxin-antitoxin system AbiEi family antitoxin domain-containing protein [Microbacterium sp.]